MSVRTILYGGEPTNLKATSKWFVVPVNHIVVLSAYNLIGGQNLYDGIPIDEGVLVQKAFYPLIDIPTLECACKDIDLAHLSDPEPIMYEDVMQCCPWFFTACNNLVSINVPGVYRLVPTGANVGTCLIEGIFYTLEEARLFPKNLILGTV